MAKEQLNRLPRGRTTIRKNGSLTGLLGPASRAIKLWTFETKPNTTLETLEQAYLVALESVDKIEERSRSSAASGRFTAEGVKADALQFALTDVLPDIHKARQTVNKAKAKVAERRAKLKIEGPEKSDAAAAIRRMDIRTQLRAMKPEQQSELFAGLGDNIPQELATAIMEVPAQFAGVPKSRRDVLMARALEIQHGSEIAAINELEEAIATAEGALNAARDEIRIEAGVTDQGKFNELAAPFEQKHAAPWLRKHKENGSEVIRVVDLDRGIERVATADEIERGIYYRDFEHFKEGQAA